MPRKRFTTEQIAFALRQAENGSTVEEICRKMGVSKTTFYRWKKQFTGMGVPEIRRLKQLEVENDRFPAVTAAASADALDARAPANRLVAANRVRNANAGKTLATRHSRHPPRWAALGQERGLRKHHRNIRVGWKAAQTWPS